MLRWLFILLCVSCYARLDQTSNDANPGPSVGAKDGPAAPEILSGDNTERVRQIFERSCTQCHGGPSPQLFNIMDVKDLESKGIVQGVANSRMYKALNREIKWMPLGKDPLPLEEKKYILQWLEEGYPELVVETPPEKLVSYAEIVECVAKDVISASEEDAEEYRYLTFEAYYNAGDNKSLSKAKEGVTKLLNSVSMSPHIEFPKAIACAGSEIVFRIRLEDFNLKARDWDNFVVTAKYPYVIDYVDDDEFEFYEFEIAKRTKAHTIAFLRADWFVHYVSQPPLYYLALFKDHSVHDVTGLEKFLNVDTFDQLFKDFEAKRALFRRSGVTNYNRIVDWYELDFWIGGIKYPAAYWKTFDTLGDKAQDKKNLFAFPFGPNYGFYPWSSLAELVSQIKDRFFEHDASEHIWVNPNGTLGFFLADGKGKRIDEALTEVAYHSSNADPYIGTKPGAVINGVSCFACHSGMNAFTDEGRHHIKASSGFTNAQVDYAKEIFFKDQTEIAKYVGATNAIYSQSQQTMKAESVYYVDTQEPVFHTAKHYFDDIDVCRLAAEFAIDCDEMKEKLIHAPDLAVELGLSEHLYGKASRPNIEYLVGRLAEELNLGKQVKFGGGAVKPHEKCVLKIKNSTHYNQRFDSIVFASQSYGTSWLGTGKSFELAHDGDALVNACLFYNSSYCVNVKQKKLSACKSYSLKKATDGYTYLFED